MGTSAFAPSRAMVEEIGCEELLQKPVTRSTLRLLLARIHVDCTTPSATALQQSPQQLAGCHLLYAEDSLPSQKIVKKMLEKVGAKCTVVDNGKKAVETVLNDFTMFDCILMVRRLIEMMLVFSVMPRRIKASDATYSAVALTTSCMELTF